jgi:hypothetical protein
MVGESQQENKLDGPESSRASHTQHLEIGCSESLNVEGCVTKSEKSAKIH